MRSIALAILGTLLLVYGLAGLGVAWYGYSTSQQIFGQIRTTATTLNGTRQQSGGAAASGTPLGSRDGGLSGLLGGRLSGLLGSRAPERAGVDSG
jgi:hypothetical protein